MEEDPAEDDDDKKEDPAEDPAEDQTLKNKKPKKFISQLSKRQQKVRDIVEGTESVPYPSEVLRVSATERRKKTKKKKEISLQWPSQSQAEFLH